ncbi:flagellin N-terminal helical domain-containing protein [Desulfoscipio sp. XC116]|uniref:flagellin N-terminal helical domain-containing protein n=1 Tax=Desulfoscipio sp. XC116 TaxID=3144975 RepID=UPI00325BBD78
MIINHNIAALNTYRQLSGNNAIGQKSLEKLSSGLRINRAGDDAAGLAISEKMRAQIRGLDQAQRNAQDGISMIQTAEGNLNETHSILQRMRELADQAANDTNVSVDRNEIQKEINALTSEINRIGNTTEFNTQKLLDGGASASGVSLSSTEAKGVAAQGGKILNLTAVSLADSVIDGATGTMTFVVHDATGTAVSFSITGEAFKTLWDQTAAGQAGADATDAMRRDALEEVLGKITSAVTFELADGTERTVTLAEVATIDVSDSGIFSIQSKIGGATISLTAASFNTMLGASTSTAITGVGTAAEEATLFGSKDIEGTDNLNRDDWAGKTFTVTYNGRTANITLGTEIGTASTGKITASDLVTAFNDAFSAVFGGSTVSATIATNPNNINDTNTYFQFTTTTTGDDVTDGTVPEFSIKGANLDQILGDFVPGQSGSGGTFRATFQIGANQGQSMTIEIKDMRSLALGISATAAGLEHTDVEGARFTEVQNVTNGTTSTTVEYALDVSSHESASAAVKVINNAIENVSGMRSELGAYQNRLEHTINNLGTSSENLTAAESRIRDVDMAKEMMEFTKMNILSQAAQAMLAQANQQPQNVLQLLR